MTRPATPGGRERGKVPWECAGQLAAADVEPDDDPVGEPDEDPVDEPDDGVVDVEVEVLASELPEAAVLEPVDAAAADDVPDDDDDDEPLRLSFL
jgi:hypothetical protein